MTVTLEQYKTTRALGGTLTPEELTQAIRVGYRPRPSELLEIGRSDWMMEHGREPAGAMELTTDVWWGLGKAPMAVTDRSRFEGYPTTIEIAANADRWLPGLRRTQSLRVAWFGWTAVVRNGEDALLVQPLDDLRRYGTDLMPGAQAEPVQWRMSDVLTPRTVRTLLDGPGWEASWDGDSLVPMMRQHINLDGMFGTPGHGLQHLRRPRGVRILGVPEIVGGAAVFYPVHQWTGDATTA